MKKASYIFEVIRERLQSVEFLEIARINPCDFTRTRLLTCQILILFVLNLLKKSIPKEMISFRKYCKISSISASAVTQARGKLSSVAFVDLNNVLIREFYTENEFRSVNNMDLPLIKQRQKFLWEEDLIFMIS
jgi:hypothetical protein